MVCGKNYGRVPNNILVDRLTSGSYSEGAGSSVLGINVIPKLKLSDWVFRELMTWNTSLSDATMVTVSAALRVLLLYCKVGVIIFL